MLYQLEFASAEAQARRIEEHDAMKARAARLAAKLPPEPNVLLAARERLATAVANHEAAQHALLELKIQSFTLWGVYEQIHIENNHQLDLLLNKKRKAGQRQLRAHARSKSNNRQKGRSFVLENERITEHYASIVTEIREKRNLLKAEVRSAFVIATQAKKAIPEAERYTVQTKSERLAAERAMQTFRVYKAAFTQVDGESDDHFAERTAYLAERCQVFVEEANIPAEYLTELVVSEKEIGEVDFYFGGTAEYNDKDHAHYTLYLNGTKTFRRPPGRGRLF